jgi:tryptophanyl-tRNA synthetase
MTELALDIVAAAQDAHSRIQAIQNEYGYADVEDDFRLADDSRPGYFAARFACHDDAAGLAADCPAADIGIVTGFGPTNSPTAGTLSVMLKAISLQRETGLHTTIVISDLGAWNSRRLDWPQLKRLTERYFGFLEMLGFAADPEHGTLRSHRDEQSLIVSGLIAKTLHEQDFKSNAEATDLLYDTMGLRGDWLSIMLDGLYTVADILVPLFRGRRRVLMIAGIEEHYFTRLARLAISRIDATFPGDLIPPGARVGAMYTKLVGGLPPYPKMSKSIPASAINIGDSEDELRRKIIGHGGDNDDVLLQMIEQVSDWSAERCRDAASSFERRHHEPRAWRRHLESYFEYYRDLARAWQGL